MHINKLVREIVGLDKQGVKEYTGKIIILYINKPIAIYVKREN